MLSQGRPVARCLARSCGSLGAMAFATQGRAVSAACVQAAQVLGQRPFAAPTWMVSSGVERRFMTSASDDTHDDFKPKRKAAPANLEDAVKLIEEQVKRHRIMLYMKGTPIRPQCGFSAQVVRVLHASGVDFDSVNVLDYPLIREGVKQYGKWPTVPQLYIEGELVGGCDIVTNLFQSGDLQKMLQSSEKASEGSKP